MKAVLIQPPFTQLNAPYPAVHYLEAFLRAKGIEAQAFDHSIELFRGLFSRAGLSRVFADARAALAARGPEPDPAAAREIERYLSYEGLYLEWADPLLSFLSGGDPALAHRLASAAELPLGMRASSFLEGHGRRIDAGEARGLATRMLEDLGDFLSYTLDPEFATVRYGERIASSKDDFGEVRAALDASYLLKAHYRGFLDAFWADQGAKADLVLISIPFPGCLLGALACARETRSLLGDKALILFGGGYVSTELRDLMDPGIFDFCDYLCFDAGYGSLASILESGPGRGSDAGAGRGLFRTMYRRGNEIHASGFGPEGSSPDQSSRRLIPCPDEEGYAREEKEALARVFPDYAGTDFGLYLRVVDSDNPMHRLWSDSPWLKFHLAHGCYWRRCAFCDTELEYVADFVPADTVALMEAARLASAGSGLSGIHFVDEAMPMAKLLAFALANRAAAARGEKPFHFWGNVRFDSAWNPDRCELLAASGLVAVSGGIEIATDCGLELTDKGFDLAGLVASLVALRRSGILVHAYLIYGFPGQDEAEIVDSAEVCRQLFASGLIDSAFWHRFVLTRHSRMYAEWREGGRPSLKPLDRPHRFADNDLGFEGESGYDRFEQPLSASLAAWMAGAELDRRADRWFPVRGRSKPPRVSATLIEDLIAEAGKRQDEARTSAEGRVFWLGGAALADGQNPGRVTWAYRGELEELRLGAGAALRVAEAISRLRAEDAGLQLEAFLEASGIRRGDEAFAALRASGLAVI
ncbi:MAG TPA: radical SAM protein [Rectinemataceae bacterium]|nr:radical SAM protein [Rectinemataceae bacterium]